MPKFIFKLEGVLRQREHAEKQRQRELALVQQQMAQLQLELRTLNDTAQRSTDELRTNRLVGRLDMNYLAAHRRYMFAVQRQAMQLMQRMALVQQQVVEAQQALAEAAKQRKAIEKLREKQRERWQADLARREMADLDEVGMQLSYQNIRDEDAALHADHEGEEAA